MIRAFIFDLDGTLVDSLKGIADALNLALREYGFPEHSEQEVADFIGNGAGVLAQRALPEDKEELAAKTLAKFYHHYQSTWKGGTSLYAGVLDLIQSLKQQGYPLAVLSNKNHLHTVEIVKTLFPENTFHPVWGQQNAFPKKPDPTSVLEIATQWKIDPSEIAYVGDSTVDLATAHHAGMKPLIFSWGYGTPEDIALFHSAQELKDYISSESSS